MNSEVNLVETTRQGAVGWLWLNRPGSLNALSPQMNRAITAALLELDADPALQVIVIAGRGRAFCAGADRKGLERMSEAGEDELELALREGAAMAQAILDARCVVISAVHRHCIGGGVSIALAADICIAAEGTRFFLPEVGHGLPLMWGSTVHMLLTLGVHRTRWFTLTESRFDATYAAQSGLVAEVVAPEALEVRAGQIAEALAAKPAMALAAQKRFTNGLVRALMAHTGDEVAAGLACIAAGRAERAVQRD